MTLLLKIAFILAYIGVGGWTFGYCAGKWAEEDDAAGYRGRPPEWYYNEAKTFFTALTWPIYLFRNFFLAGLITAGAKRGLATAKRKRIRVEIENKLRIEEEKIQAEIDQEVDREFSSSS